MPTATALYPLFAARVSRVDIGRTLPGSGARWLRDARDCRSVLVLPAPVITDDLTVAFRDTFTEPCAPPVA